MRGLLMDIYVRAEGLAAKYARFTRAPLPVDVTRDARRGVAVGTAPTSLVVRCAPKRPRSAPTAPTAGAVIFILYN
jgi:hypothetical protein